MANSSDSSSKGPAKPGGDPKKPTAIIDLKASEVDIRDPKQDAAKPQASATGTAAAGTDKVGDAGPAGKTGSAAGAAPSGTEKQASASSPGSSSTKPSGSGAASTTTPSGSSAGKPGVDAAKPAATAPTSTPPQATMATSSGSGLRGAATHLVAGLAGGLLALLGAETLGPKLGLTGAGASRSSQELSARLGELEALSKRPAAPDLTQKLVAAEARLAQLEQAGRAIADLTRQQAALAGETKALGEKIAQVPADNGADARLAKLEETFNALVTAAQKDPQSGRLAQLATIIGRLGDLETSLNTQIAALRKSVTQEVDSRLSQSTEAAQAARAGTQRLDRDLAGIKTEAAQLSQSVDGLKAQGERLDVALRGLRDEAGALKREIGTVREEVTRELKQVARPTDVVTAITPLTSKLSLLEQNVQGVVRSDDDRRTNIERIVMALELGNLKRTVERGVGFANELAEVRRVAGPKLDLSVLERYKDKGVPALGELEREFRGIAFAIIEADAQPANAHWTDRLMASAKSVVRVRKVDQGADDKGVESQVARMESSLKAGRLVDVVAEAGKLSEKAKVPALAWLQKVEARAAVDRAIATIERELKGSLGAASQAGKKD